MTFSNSLSSQSFEPPFTLHGTRRDGKCFCRFFNGHPKGLTLHAACLKSSSRRNQLVNGFQLPKVWSTKPSLPDLISRRAHFQEQMLKSIMSTDELLAQALRLTRVERARVAEELLSSLEESDEEVATAWATELERRSRDVAEGRVQTTSWDTARTEILKELEQRRASRTTS